MKPYLSVIIPAYNEAKRLPRTLEETLSWLYWEGFNFEIIVVDDGSVDATKRLVLEFMRAEKRIKLLSYPQNRGKGYAVKVGMLKAKGRLRLFMDADASTPISELKRLLVFAKEFDVIIGSRRLDRSLVKPPSFLRDLLSLLGNLAVRIFLGLNFKDTQCGFKLFNERVALSLFSNLEIFGWGFDIAILALAQKKGMTIKEVAVSWQQSPGSKLRAGRAFLKTFFELWRIRKLLKSVN